MLYIGTHNAEKAKNMALALQLVAGELEFSDIFSFNILLPKELGKSEVERAESKSRYYFQRLSMSAISEDDGFYFDKTLPINGLSISDIDTNGMPAFDFWKDLFMTNNATGGVLRKAYSICVPDSLCSVSFDVPFSITFTEQRSLVLKGNTLNRFIVPDGFDTSLAYMTDVERNEFRIKCIVEPLKKLLRQARLINQ